jgi:hypothetical protein
VVHQREEKTIMSISMPRVLPIALIIVLLVGADRSHATTWYVPGDASSIQSGIYAASAGDTVLVACGEYLEHDIQLRTGVTIRGAGEDPGCVVVDAQGLDRVFDGYDVADVRLERMTITGGGAGGVVVRQGEGIVVRECVFRANEGSIQGGGLYVVDGTATVQDCRFTDNASSHRGGGLGANDATVTVTGCTFDGNSSGFGGGLGLLNATGTIAGCVFTSNTAQSDGGGLVATHSDSEIESCEFLANEARYGGGLALCEGHHPIAGCTIADNVAEIFGGGLYIHEWGAGHANVDLHDSLVSGNEALSAAGGVFLASENDFDAWDSVILQNTSDAGADGLVYDTVHLVCCDVDLSQWGGSGAVYLDNSDCGVATEEHSWSAVKELFR